MKLFRPMTALLLVSAMVLGVGPPRPGNLAYADQRPAGCKANGITLITSVDIPPEVHLGTPVMFHVKVVNPASDPTDPTAISCDISDMTLTVNIKPDGTAPLVYDGLSLAHGEIFLKDIPYEIRANDVKDLKVTAKVRVDGQAHDNTGSNVGAYDEKSVPVPAPTITVDRICTVGPTAGTPEHQLVVDGSTTDAVDFVHGVNVGNTTVTTTVRAGGVTTVPDPQAVTLSEDGSWTDTFEWAQPGGPYDLWAKVAYGVNNSATSPVVTSAIYTITLDDGEAVTTDRRKPIISGTSDAPDSTPVLVTIDGVEEPATVNAGVWSVEWTHDLDYGIPYPVKAELGGAFCASDTQAITVVNDPPKAFDDPYEVDEDETLDVPYGLVPGVLANDTDPNNDALTPTLVDGPHNGQLTKTLQPDGSFTYKPNADFAGDDTFTYFVEDGFGGKSNVATVTIHVRPVNDPPQALDDSYKAVEGRPLAVDPSVLANDKDIDTAHDKLKARIVSAPTDAVAGTFQLPEDGIFQYTPKIGTDGVDTFTYVAFDDGPLDSNVATVTIAIDRAPVAENDSYKTNEGQRFKARTSLLKNDWDPDPDPKPSLSAVLVDPPGKGTLEWDPLGFFTYKPDASARGKDTFTYKASYIAIDGLPLESNVATVTITLAPPPPPPPPPNQPPTANDDAYSTEEGKSLTIPAAGVLANDTDPDGDALRAKKVDNPNKGTVTLNSDGSFTYTPNPGATGVDTFTYRANDSHDDSNLATVRITIIDVNHPPLAENDTYRTTEETPLTVAAPGVLGNDSDPDGDKLSAILVTGPTKGTLTLNSNGSFVYTPNFGATGSDSFTYRANDGSADSNTATVTIAIDPNPAQTWIEGTVIDAATGQPVAGATVKVNADFNGDGTADLSQTGVTGTDGKYRFEVARRDWTYTALVTASVEGPTGPVSVTTTHRTEVKPWGAGVFQAEKKIAGRLTTTDWQVAGLLLDASGSVLDKPVTVHPDGTFEVADLTTGGYLTVLQVVSSDGSKLAGAALPAKISGPGELVIGANLINPLGQVTDAVSLKPVEGAKVTLYWADTQLNRERGRIPDTRVSLPALPDLLPGLNAMPQETTADGEYAWFFFPEGDYYIRADSDRYLPYDSRVEGRDEAATAGQENYVQDGVIHVGHAALHYDFVMVPIHRRFIIGYPDGTFKPERYITRAEVAAILARNTTPVAVTLPAPPFKDVPADHWAATYIELVRQKGFMEADAAGNFRPDEPITRAELASAISRFEDLVLSDVAAFPDIKGNWAEKEINAAFQAGLVQGYPNGTFQPESPTRRDEAATMFNRMLGRGPLSGRPYATWPDVPLTNWASVQVEEASNSHSAVRDPAGGERWIGDTGETTW